MFTIAHLRTKIDTVFSGLSGDAQTIMHKFVDSIENDYEDLKLAIRRLEGLGYAVTPTSQVGAIGEDAVLPNAGQSTLFENRIDQAREVMKIVGGDGVGYQQDPAVALQTAQAPDPLPGAGVVYTPPSPAIVPDTAPDTAANEAANPLN